MATRGISAGRARDEDVALVLDAAARTS